MDKGYLEYTLESIIEHLKKERGQHPVLMNEIPSEKWIKLNWLFDLFQNLMCSVKGLNAITKKYQELYELEDAEPSSSYLVKEFISINYHSRSFLEGIYTYSDAFKNVFKFNILYGEEFKEIQFVRKIRSFFVVHPDLHGMSFGPSIPVKVSKKNILMSKISFSHFLEEADRKKHWNEVFDRSGSHDEYLKKLDEIRLKIKQKIVDHKGYSDSFWTGVDDELKSQIRLYGLVAIDQEKLGREIEIMQEYIIQEISTN